MLLCGSRPCEAETLSCVPSSPKPRTRKRLNEPTPHSANEAAIRSERGQACEADTVDEAEAFIGAANITLPLGIHPPARPLLSELSTPEYLKSVLPRDVPLPHRMSGLDVPWSCTSVCLRRNDRQLFSLIVPYGTNGR